MNMTREDVLRELELLPVWKENPTQGLATVRQLAQPVVDTIAAVADVLIVFEHVPALESTAIQAAPLSAPALEKIAVTWLLYCPLAEANVDAPANADVLTLLKNMINAMQLLSTDYQLVHDAEALAQYQPRQTLLFGLDAANTVLGTQAPDIGSLGNQPILHAQSHCWAIDHPADLLQTPMRKRLAWQIMCEAKAYAKQTATPTV